MGSEVWSLPMAQRRGDQNQSPWLHGDPKGERESSRQRSEMRGAENQRSTLPGPRLGEGRKHIWKAALGGRGTDPTGSSEKPALKCKAGTAPLMSGWRGAPTRPSQPATGEFLAKEGSWAGRSGLREALSLLREWNTHVPTAAGIETALLSSRALPSHPRPVSAQKRDFAKKPVPEDSHCLKTCVFLEQHSFLEREQTLSPPWRMKFPEGLDHFPSVFYHTRQFLRLSAVTRELELSQRGEHFPRELKRAKWPQKIISALREAALIPAIHFGDLPLRLGFCVRS